MGSGQCFADCGYSFAGQGFEVASGEIFFAELDVIDSSGCGFMDFFEETTVAGGFVCGERGAVGDVVQKQKAFTTKGTGFGSRTERSGIRFGDLRQDFGLLLRGATQVIFCQAIFQEFEGFFWRVEELKLVEIFG